MEIAIFGGDDKEDVFEWLDGWNRSVAANGWTPEEEQVMLPLYLVGRASQHYRTISQQVKNDIILLTRDRIMDIKCWNCWKRGHFANKCAQPRTRKSEASQD